MFNIISFVRQFSVCICVYGLLVCIFAMYIVHCTYIIRFHWKFRPLLAQMGGGQFWTLEKYSLLKSNFYENLQNIICL